jgi:cyclophilin family peptidyl-prolyl cis-trans isomerase
MRRVVVACALAFLAFSSSSAQRATAPAAAPADPIMTIETPRGAIEIRFFRAEAPKSVAQILSLAGRNFFRGQRIHRVERTLVQFGDPKSRDMSWRESWGRTSSGNPIGVAEFNKRLHERAAVGLAHSGDARGADSQLYILKVAAPHLNGKHVVVGQVIKGMDVVDKLQVADLLKNVTLK